MQFCMHYAFETEAKVRIMLDNVSRYLDPGGTFIGTVPNAEKLLCALFLFSTPRMLTSDFRGLLDSIPPEAETLEAGNSVYRITFDSREPFEQGQVFGVRYRFFLFDAVDDVPEFVVFWEPFVECALPVIFPTMPRKLTLTTCRLAAEYGLELIYKDEFHYLYQTEQDHPEFGQLLRKMKVLDLEGNSQMDAEQWEAASTLAPFPCELVEVVVIDRLSYRLVCRIRISQDLRLASLVAAESRPLYPEVEHRRACSVMLCLEPP